MDKWNSLDPRARAHILGYAGLTLGPQASIFPPGNKWNWDQEWQRERNASKGIWQVSEHFPSKKKVLRQIAVEGAATSKIWEKFTNAVWDDLTPEDIKNT